MAESVGKETGSSTAPGLAASPDKAIQVETTPITTPDNRDSVGNESVSGRPGTVWREGGHHGGMLTYRDQTGKNRPIAINSSLSENAPFQHASPIAYPYQTTTYAGYTIASPIPAPFPYVASGSNGAGGGGSPGGAGNGNRNNGGNAPVAYPHYRYPPQGVFPFYAPDGTYQVMPIPQNHALDGFGNVVLNPNANVNQQINSEGSETKPNVAGAEADAKGNGDSSSDRKMEDNSKHQISIIPHPFLPQPPMLATYPYGTPFPTFQIQQQSSQQQSQQMQYPSQLPGFHPQQLFVSPALKTVRMQSKSSLSAPSGSGKETPKKFVCPHNQCGRAFARNFNLQSHIKSHLGVREFKCPECNKKFSRRHDCMRHCIAIHHYTKETLKKPIKVSQTTMTDKPNTIHAIATPNQATMLIPLPPLRGNGNSLEPSQDGVLPDGIPVLGDNSENPTSVA